MQKIFINHTTFVLTEQIPQNELEACSFEDLKSKDIHSFIAEAEQLSFPGQIIIYGAREQDLLDYFRNKLIYIEAGGGLVQNPSDEILFIHRLGKWDLPKGKPEDNESIEITAIREVEEECNIKNLEIKSALPSTWHMYATKPGKYAIKQSYWYHMRISQPQQPIPQTAEAITDARWIKMPVPAKIMDNAFLSIKELVNYFQQYY